VVLAHQAKETLAAMDMHRVHTLVEVVAVQELLD
jgi:hypothetical protein